MKRGSLARDASSCSAVALFVIGTFTMVHANSTYLAALRRVWSARHTV
jgi:hypothetical protein